jgi:hydroxymethylglutaryl-CoA synthase
VTAPVQTGEYRAPSRGILGWGGYLPYRRLDRSTIAAVAGQGGGRGVRSVASYDEDSTTLAVEACRLAMRGRERGTSPTVWFCTTTPAYLDKTNATAIHAALGLDRSAAAYDAIGSVRSWVGSVRAALASDQLSMVVAADVRTGWPGGSDEAANADAAAALLIGPDRQGDAVGDVLAEVISHASLTEEFLERWRLPSEPVSRTWEERFGEAQYVPLGLEALKTALAGASLDADAVDHLIVSGLHERAVAAVERASGVTRERLADRLAATAGNPGAAQPGLLLAATLERARPGQIIVLVALADGAEAIVLRTTPALAAYRPSRTIDVQLASGGPVAYGRYLAWRGLLPVEPPRRPSPARPSAPAASRSAEWKYGLVASHDTSGEVHMPPSPSDVAAHPMAEAVGTVVTFTIDRLTYSQSPPTVFAVVDFDGGGRLPVELTDVDPEDVAVGNRVEMTFRRLFTADGIHNYFWKARPIRGEAD